MGGTSEPSCAQQLFTSSVVGFGAGAMVGAINAAWSNAPAAKDQMGAVVRTTARTIQTNALLYAAVGGIFSGTECTVRSLRGKNDPYNGMVAGCAAGAFMGFSTGRPVVAAGGCAAAAAVSAMYDLARGRFGPHPMTATGLKGRSEEDEH